MKENREQCYKRLTTDGRKISSLIDESQKLFHAMVRTQIFAEVTHIDNRNEKIKHRDSWYKEKNNSELNLY